MSSAPSRGARLLRADEEQLERAARVLGGGGAAFVIVLCPADLRPAALSLLRKRVAGLEVAEPAAIGTPEEALAALEGLAQIQSKVFSLRLERDVEGALQALNWHREKLLRGAPVVLWLEDDNELRNLREIAPDAYSFREMLALVRGDGGPLPVPSGEEPPEVTQARRRLKRARTPLERAVASQALAEDLREAGRVEEAAQVAERALEALPAKPSDDDEAHEARAFLCFSLASIMRKCEADGHELRWRQLALTEAEQISFSRSLPIRALLASWVGPIGGRDRARTEEAMNLVHAYGLAPEVHFEVLRSASEVAVAAGDLRRARALLKEVHALASHLQKRNVALAVVNWGNLEKETGDMAAAEQYYRDASVTMASEGGANDYAAVRLAYCVLEKGEIEVAERTEDTISAAVARAPFPVRPLRAYLALSRGEVRQALMLLHQDISEAARADLDGACIRASQDLASMMEEVRDADRLTVAHIDTATVALETAQDIILARNGPDGPPWIPIQFLTARAQVLALDPSTLDKALHLGREALDKARSIYPDLIPACGRALAEHLLRASRPDDTLTLLTEIEPEAASRSFLKELARIRAARLRALVQRSADPGLLASTLTSLRETLAATDSRRITAETLRDLAINLPPSASLPDPLSLAEEAHALFLAMPIPAEEARCLEAAGDILLARGRAPEAKRRYLAARARLERYGLALRLPLLTRKLDGIA